MPFGRALGALTANVLDYPVKVFLAIIVNNFFAGPDCLARPNPYATLCDNGFRVRRARMIDITRDVIAAAAVNRPFPGHPEKVFAVAFIDNFVRHPGTNVLDDLLAFGNASGGEKSETGG